jgi:hypothetical protein
MTDPIDKAVSDLCEAVANDLDRKDESYRRREKAASASELELKGRCLASLSRKLDRVPDGVKRFEVLVGHQMLQYCAHTRIGWVLATIAAAEGREPIQIIAEIIARAAADAKMPKAKAKRKGK